MASKEQLRTSARNGITDHLHQGVTLTQEWVNDVVNFLNHEGCVGDGELSERECDRLADELYVELCVHGTVQRRA